ncbi:MAG: (2Fe-2S) ferredoxin domain-containing protein [Spirochaetes bacterium]|nr:(2Fe-2S) ferredoxin domain-containing protein [Spirochaetota bacterium]
MNKHRIEICLGSSCFIRGNNQFLTVIKDFMERTGIQKQVEVIGRLCEGNCKKGPVILIDGQSYQNLQLDSLEKLLIDLKERIKEKT